MYAEELMRIAAWGVAVWGVAVWGVAVSLILHYNSTIVKRV